MAEEAKTDMPETTDAATVETVDAPKADKTYTQSEVEAMMTARLSGQEKALRKQFADDQKKATDRAKLEESERLKAEKEDVERERDDALKSAKLAGYRAALKGEVADMDTALLILERHEDKYIKNDEVDIKGLLKDKPFLNPVKQPSAPGGGGVQERDYGNPTDSLAAARAADSRS